MTTESSHPFSGRRPRVPIHLEIRTHHLKIAGIQHRPIREARILVPETRAPTTAVGIEAFVAHARVCIVIPIDGEERSVELDREGATTRTGRPRSRRPRSSFAARTSATSERLLQLRLATHNETQTGMRLSLLDRFVKVP